MIQKDKVYGFDVMEGRWVERDKMLALNIKVFDENNDARTIRIRVSKEHHEKLVEELEKLGWSGETKYGREIEENGLPHEGDGKGHDLLVLEVHNGHRCGG